MLLQHWKLKRFIPGQKNYYELILKIKSMPKMNGTGPDKKGKLSGRGLGQCKKVSDSKDIEKLGIGMGLRRMSGDGKGQGKRSKSGI